MKNDYKKVTLKALEEVRIRVDGEKVDLNAWDLISVNEWIVGYYLRNWFWFENDEIIKKKALKKKSKKETEEEVEQEDKKDILDVNVDMLTTEIDDVNSIDEKNQEQAEKAKEEGKE